MSLPARIALSLLLLASCARTEEGRENREATMARLAPSDLVPDHSTEAATVESSPEILVSRKEAEPIVPSEHDGEDLLPEAREVNPNSDTVKLKLSVSPPLKAVVMWGGKQVAKLTPGSMDAELSRPRGSGPLDLEIRSEGYLPYHTRLYADRNDRVSVRLWRAEDAPGLFGYRRPMEAAGKKR
jgi:hypothetical protein